MRWHRTVTMCNLVSVLAFPVRKYSNNNKKNTLHTFIWSRHQKTMTLLFSIWDRRRVYRWRFANVIFFGISIHYHLHHDLNVGLMFCPKLRWMYLCDRCEISVCVFFFSLISFHFMVCSSSFSFSFSIMVRLK